MLTYLLHIAHFACTCFYFCVRLHIYYILHILTLTLTLILDLGCGNSQQRKQTSLKLYVFKSKVKSSLATATLKNSLKGTLYLGTMYLLRLPHIATIDQLGMGWFETATKIVTSWLFKKKIQINFQTPFKTIIFSFFYTNLTLDEYQMVSQLTNILPLYKLCKLEKIFNRQRKSALFSRLTSYERNEFWPFFVFDSTLLFYI